MRSTMWPRGATMTSWSFGRTTTRPWIGGFRSAIRTATSSTLSTTSHCGIDCSRRAIRRLKNCQTRSPGVLDGNFRAGVSAQIDHGYNVLPSTWVQAHVLQYGDGKRTLIVMVDGRFRAPHQTKAGKQ